MSYTPTVWKDDDLITADRMNKLEQGVANEQQGPAGADGKDGAPGPAGADGKDGAPGEKGDPGEGVPPGGAKDQILAKRSAADYDTYWVDPPSGGGGGTAGVSSFNERTGAVLPESGDYTAAMVGARPADWMPTAADVGAATMEAVNAAIDAAITGAIKEAY